MSRDDKARELVAQGAELIDVRNPGEFAGGHVEGAVNLPVGSLKGSLDQLDPERPVVVYCKSGMRSAAAARLLRSSGFSTVHDMGSMTRWDGRLDWTRYMILGLFCVTLGLAPLDPEPHIVGKLRWLAGGGTGMQWLDVGDLLMHGAPWLLLFIQIGRDLWSRLRPV